MEKEFKAEGTISRMYTEEEIQKTLDFYTDDAPASYIKRDLIKSLQIIKIRNGCDPVRDSVNNGCKA